VVTSCFNRGLYFCLFIASASFCSPAYIIPPAIHASTIIATPVNKVATSTVTSSPPAMAHKQLRAIIY
jgi:hypothetical protein